MARRSRSRSRSHTGSRRRPRENPRRHSSRRAIPVVHYEANAPRRRARHRWGENPRRRHARRNPSHRRHHYRRNPPGALGDVLRDLKGGGLVYGGWVANRKLGTLIQGFLPTSAGAASGALSAGTAYLAAAHIGGAIVTGLLARMILPKAAAEITMGAFAEAVNQVVMVTPAAPYVSAYVRPALPAPSAAGVRAYPRLVAGGGVSAYARPKMATAGNAG